MISYYDKKEQFCGSNNHTETTAKLCGCTRCKSCGYLDVMCQNHRDEEDSYKGEY